MQLILRDKFLFSSILKCEKYNYFCHGFIFKSFKQKQVIFTQKIKVMKKLNVFASVLICLVLVSVTAVATGLRSEFKEYKITPVDDVIVGKNVKAIWSISYSNDETPVTVVKRKTLDGIEYVVYSKYFEVGYLASATKGFGARMVKNSWSNVPKKINRAVINMKELKKQEILTPNKVNDEQALGLIASYLPLVLNEGYTHLLN